MIAAGIAIDLWGAAELAHGDDERRIEHAALVQIFEQRGEGAIELRQQHFFHGIEIVAMRIVVEPALGDGHEAHAAFHQPARQ